MLWAGKISTLILNPQDHNRGLGVSVNRAVDISEGKYIIKVNGDDEFKPGWLAKAVKVMQVYPEIGLLHLAAYDYGPLHNIRFPEDQWAPGKDYTTLYRARREGISIRVVWCGPGDGLMFTRETWKRVGGWPGDYDLSFGADVTWRLRCCPMMRRPLTRPPDPNAAVERHQLRGHWEEYRKTPWLAMMDPPVVDFSWGTGQTLVAEAQKTLKYGPLLLGRI